MPRPDDLPPRRRFARPWLAGALAVAGLVAAALGLAAAVPAVGASLWAMGLGVTLAPAVRALPGGPAAARLAARPLLRVGVALLGLRVSLGNLAALGPAGAVLDVGTVAATLGSTVVLAQRLGVPSRLALLIGTGSAICGASAIAAMASATNADEEEAGYAVATVTVFGTLATVLVPLLGRHVLRLTPHEAALWAGASIHEVAQVAAAGAAISSAALATATLVKLGRVVLLAPTVALLATRHAGPSTRRPVPGFVLAFLALAVVRTVAAPPPAVLHAAGDATNVLLAAGLAGLGLAVRPAALRAAGARPLALGLAAWAIAAGVSLALVLLVA